MPQFYLRVLPSDTLKIVISVSKKVSKKAVVRNRIRRRVRPIVQEFKKKLKPATYFIVAKPGAENMKGEELNKEMVLLFKKSYN